MRMPGFESWLLAEMGRARLRIASLRDAHPHEDLESLSKRLIEARKRLALEGGVVTGFFGWLSLPADIAFSVWVQATLVVELGVLHGANLKSPSGRAELLEVLGLKERSLGMIWPQLALSATRATLRRLGWKAVGRGVPVIAAPFSVWANGRELERVAADARRRFTTFRRLRRTIAA